MKKSELNSILPYLLEMDDVKTHVYPSFDDFPLYNLEINCGKFTIDYEFFYELYISTNDGTPIAPYIPQITTIVAKILVAVNSLDDETNCYEMKYDGYNKNAISCKFINA